MRQVLVFGSAFSLLLLFGSFGVFSEASSDWQQANAYRKSPNCISGASASAGFTPCVFLTEHVVSKRQKEGYRGAVHELVELQSGQSAPQEAEIIDRRCWDSLAAGDSVTTQTWHGHIMTVTAHNRHSETALNPIYCLSTDRLLLFLLVPLTLFFVTMTILAWKKIRSEKAAPAQ